MMSNFKKYPIKDFSTNQKFLADDPNQVVRVTGQSMLDANIEAMKKSGKVVNSIDTLTEAIAGDYLSGIYLLVGGGTVTLDGDQAIYRVSDAGSGGIVMANGNELVLLFVANTPANIITPIDSVENIAGYTGTADDQQISLKGWHPDSDVGGGTLYWDSAALKSTHNGGTIFSPTVPWTTTTADYLNAVGETDPAGAGAWVRAGIGTSAYNYGYQDGVNFVWPEQLDTNYNAQEQVPQKSSYTLNGRFNNFDRGTPIDTTGNADEYIAARWRLKKTTAADAVIASKTTAFDGGLTLDITSGSGEFFYIRQLIPEVMRFNTKTLTAVAEIANAPSGFSYDWYILARFNTNDVERVVIIDSDQLALPVGASTQRVTMNVPDLALPGYTLSEVNSLEFAFRLISTSVQTNAIVDVKGIYIYDGVDQASIAESDKYKEENEALQFYENIDFKSFNGLNDNGRQRVQFQMSTPKRLGILYFETLSDAVGNVGKISTYDNAGARTDNITPLAISKKINSVEVIYGAPVGATGIGASIEIDSEF